MKALVFEGPHTLSVQDRDDPVASPGDAIIEVAYSGICGSDLHGYTGTTGRRFPGTVMGHEASGRIVDVGAGLSKELLGEKVTFNPILPCDGECGHDQENRCSRLRLIGVHKGTDGAFADRVRVPIQRVHKVSDRSLQAAAMAEPLAVAVHAFEAVREQSGPLLVIGGGMIGLAVAALATATGIHDVTVSEIDEKRISIARAAGFNAHPPEDLDDSGFTRAIDAVGNKGSAETALHVTRPGATIAVVGLGHPEVPVSTQSLVGGERRLVGSFAYNNAEFGEALRLVDQVLGSLPYSTVTLQEAPDAFADLAAGRRHDPKILVDMTSGHPL